MTDPPLEIRDETVSGLLLTRDLMFISKVVGTAAALGLRIETVGAIDALQSRAAATRPRAVFIDLASTDFDPRAVLERLNYEPRPLVVAFGSHVDVERLELARAAGCDQVLPRSRFSANLPELLRQIFRVEP